MVLSAGQNHSPEAARALETLCQVYWYPLFAYVRRTGRQVADAEDLTQAFFARLLEKDWLAEADRERGRFRSFLLGSLKHFLANEWDKAQARKRGGGCHLVSLDAQTADRRLQQEPADAATPETAFDRRWALTLLSTVLDRLGKDYAQGGKTRLFEQLKGTLEGDRSEISYARLAQELALSEGAVRVAAHRLRRRYRELLREEISQTVSSPDEVEDEWRHLLQALSS